MNAVLDEFKNLDRLQQIGMQRKFDRDDEYINSDDFACMLRDIYQDHECINFISGEICEVRHVPHFSIQELQTCLQKCKSNKSADAENIVFEMLRYGNDRLHDHILSFFNDILDHQQIDES